MNVRFVPIVNWPGPRTKVPAKAQFKQTVGNTVELLKYELSRLNAKNVLIQFEGDASQIKQDGWPYADAKFGDGVILTFDSMHGPLSYPCDNFSGWWNNLRAIALALKALRDVDRYGVTKRGEQYTGWKALPATAGTTMTATAAAEIYTRMGGGNARDVLATPAYAADVYRRAARAVHPDAGGSVEDFQTLQTARRVLDHHHGNGKR